MQVDERAAVRRLLQRVGFGPRPGELETATATGFTVTLEALLSGQPDDLQAPPVLQPLPTGRDQQQAANQLRRDQIEQLRNWWLERMTSTEHPLSERLTFFWHDVFATSVQKVREPTLMLAQHQTQRRLGAGEFGPLAAAMTTDAAMLIWLDGHRNQRGRPNENLARELMELFTIGVGHYSEEDVEQAARALTGWRVDRATGTAVFEPRRHDPGVKTVLGHTAAMGAAELVDLLARQPQCPRFVAGRMWARFVSDTPPTTQRLDELAQRYEREGTVVALLRAVLESPEFRAPQSVLVRQPVEWLVAGCRALGVRPVGDRLTVGLAALGQQLFAPPSVAGWPSGAAWLTTSAARTRLGTAAALAEAADLSPIDAVSPSQQVDAVARLLSLDWTRRTADALGEVAGDPRALVTLALVSPENLVSA